MLIDQQLANNHPLLSRFSQTMTFWRENRHPRGWHSAGTQDPISMNITEKILASRCGKDRVSPGQYVVADVDLCLGNDVTAPIAIEEFRKAGFESVFDNTRIALIPDHFTPNKDIKAAQLSATLRNFAREHDIVNYFEVGRVGIEHVLLPEQGMTGPGELIIGADSHTCTYGALGAFSTGVGSTDLAAAMATGKVWLRIPESLKFHYSGVLPEWVGGKDVILHTIARIGVDGALYKAMEFCGPIIENLPMDDRFTICNMAIEAGGKNGIIAPDDTTRAYWEEHAPARNHSALSVQFLASDADAGYAETYEWDLSSLAPQVAAPFLPSNAAPVDNYKDTEIDQVVIGSCTNGRLSDLRIAAEILKGHRTAPNVRTLIFPGSQEVYRRAMNEGLFDTFLDADCAISPPTCGPCLGGHMGILAAGERALSTTNRNFRGRMGHPESEVFLCNPAVAAASAVTGTITHPKDVAGK